MAYDYGFGMVGSQQPGVIPASPYQTMQTPGYQAPTGSWLDQYTSGINDARDKNKAGGLAGMDAYNQIMNSGGTYQDAMAAAQNAGTAIMYPGQAGNPDYQYPGAGAAAVNQAAANAHADPTFGTGGPMASANFPTFGASNGAASGFGMVGSQGGGSASGYGTYSSAPALAASYPPGPDGQTPGVGPAYGGGSPWLEQQGNAIFNRLNDNFTRNTLPALRYGSMAAGGFGGSRQGVMEANAVNDMNRVGGDAYANLMGQDWTNAQNRKLQDEAQRNQFYLDNRSLDYTGLNTGANLFSLGQNGEFDPLKNANSIYTPYTGLGTTSQGSQSGGGLLGALGGALGAGQLANNFGWFK